MKGRFFAAAAALALLASPAIALAQAAGIHMTEGSWNDVLAEAKRQNKPIYLDAYASWCGPCKMLKRDIFSRKDVGDFFNANYIAVSIDMEKGEGIELAKKYSVVAYPTHLYFDPDGTIVHRAVGGGSGDEFAATFVQWAKDARNPETQIYTMKRHFDQGDRDPEMLRRLALGAKNSGMEEASYYALEYFRTQNDDEMLDERNWDALKTLVTDMDQPGFSYLFRHRKAYAAKYGDVAVEAVLLNVVGRQLASLQSVTNFSDKLYTHADSLFRATTSKEDMATLARPVLSYYQSKEDWDGYARTAATYIEKAGVTDPDEINEIAWTFFQNVKDKAMLAKAIGWVEKAIAQQNSYAISDTYASLLFKAGRKKDAQRAAEQAIELGKKGGDNYASTEELLAKIKKM